MMINKENSQIADMIAFLIKIGVSAQDCALAEEYLNGEVGDEVLDQFQRIDFAAKAVSYELQNELYKLMKGCNQSEKRQTCIRLFHVLFAIGHNTCSALLYQHVFHDLEDAQECELYKRVVIFIENAAENTGYLHDYDMKRLMDMGKNDPENFRKMTDQLKEEGSKYFITVLAVYFCMKYGKIGPLADDDETLMKAYERALLACLDEWLAQQFCDTHREVTETIQTHQLTKELLDSLRHCRFTEPERKQLCFIGGMAYLNFQFSDVLRDIVKACLAIDTEWMLFTFTNVSIGTADASRRIGSSGGDYDELFGIDPETYIRWAAVEGHTHILKRQLDKNQESYLKAMDESGYHVLLAKGRSTWDSALGAVNRLKDVLKKKNPKLYEQIDAAKPNYERIISDLVRDTPHVQLAREYLHGTRKISELYPYADEFDVRYVYDIHSNIQKRHCSDEGFFNRCKVLSVLAGAEFTTVVENGEEEPKEVEKFFQMLDNEQMDIAHQLGGFVTAYKAYDGFRGCKLRTLVEGAVNTFTRYFNEQREETMNAFSSAKAEGRYLALLVMRKDAVRNKQEILSYASDNSKLVREELLDILYGQKGWENDITTLLDAKKAAQRELAVQVIAHWQQEDGNYNKVLLQAMEKEKNAKVLNLLQSALKIQESDLPKEILSKDDLVNQLHKGNKKKSLAWAYEKPFSQVHNIAGDHVSEEYLQAVLLCYASQDKCGINKNAELLAKEFNTAEFAVYVNELFDKWIAAGAESKKRWVLYAASIHGGEDIIQRLQHQIQEWPQNARGAIASEAVKALALNPSPRALLIVDGIARKFKFKQVKAAAGEALDFAAAELGITREELSDRIVPDLGFNENMERMFDYGEHMFRVILTPALEIEVYDENGKKLKNLPSPGKKDDESKAAAAYAEFKDMKKQMKTTVTSQKARLEYALSVKREWCVDAWKALFVKNPLMHQFAMGLIWGVYEDEKLIQSFRYMEDGSFNTQDEEEYTLPKDARISLVHPMELSDEDKAAWKEQLADYEITQPIEQLDRTVYYMTEEEADKQGLERFGGCVINDLSLNGKLTGLGWYRGSVQDAGGFDTYYREDAEAGIGVELHFSGTYVGGLGEDVTIYDVRFYEAGTIARGSYVYDEADEEKAYFLKDVPSRYFSEIVLQLAKATASSEERNENWKKDAGL